MKSRRRATTVLMSCLAALLMTQLVACQDKKPESDENSNDLVKLIFIGQITDTANATPLPEAAAGARAAVAAINARGGLAGKKLDLHICDDRADANEAAKCARKAAREGMVAAVGNTSNFGNVILPVLQQAGVASIGHNPISPSDFANPVAFPVQAGSPGLVAGAAKLLADNGATRIRLAAVDSPAGAASARFAEAGLTGSEASLVGMTLVPIGAPDYAIYANTVLQDSDGILLSMNADQAARFIAALRQTGSNTPVATVLPALPPATIAQLGKSSDGIYVAASFRPTTAGGKANEQYLADMATYEPEAKINGFSQQAWLAVEMFYRAMTQHPQTAITAGGVLETMSKLDGLALDEIIPPYSTATERQAPFNRLFNNQVLYGQVKEGQINLLDEQWHRVDLVSE